MTHAQIERLMGLSVNTLTDLGKQNINSEEGLKPVLLKNLKDFVEISSSKLTKTS